MTKYNARKTTIDGIKFDSKKEADYYCELVLRKKAGDILDFDLQPDFHLQEPFTDNMGKKHRAIKYIADFIIYHNLPTEEKFKVEVVDVKGFKTKEYQIKKKLFLKKYPHCKFTEV